ncbi:beta-lactam antibiotic acylase [Planctomycetia bacterium]|nr:beta-lactam antibiotic acylase [Planctomycetia bacterium]
MNALGRDVLRRLGAGEAINSICQLAGWTRAEFDERWKREAASRAPQCDGQVATRVIAAVTIERDRWGIPHIFADSHRDLWFGLGYAMAQDRLFQMDYLRRKGLGRLAEVLGPEGVPLDLIARTVGLNRIAKEEWLRLPQETRELQQAFADGVNAWIKQCGEHIPIEFDLLDYRPEPWSPIDSLAIESEFRWYLTGRFPVIVMPELAKRVLGDGPLYREFLLGEADEEAVVPPEAYQHLREQLGQRPLDDVGQATGDPEGTGSNNWVVAGRHCKSGMPMVASDPHIAIEAVSCWYEAHLCGGDFNVAGMAYVGMPAIMFGRNERVAWGITNNICSLRDLYQERVDPEHPNCFQFDGRWEPAREVVEKIRVRGAEPISRTIRFSRNGPVVDEILPAPGNTTGPVTLKWLGAYHGGWLTALLGMDRAKNVAEFREALRPWHVPTFNLVIADVAGQIAVHCAGRIPQRKTGERGYRAGWNPDQQWTGLLPFESMPHAVDPPRGWLASANNRLAADDYPFPLFGTWIGGYRAVRIRQMIEAGIAKTASSTAPRGFTVDDFRAMHHDTASLRAVTCLPPLIAALSDVADPQVQAAVKLLQGWDGRIETDLVAPTLFNVFFTFWSKAVADAHFEGLTAELLAKQVEGVASRLLAEDPHGWFAAGERLPRIRRAFSDALAFLAERFGADMSAWHWGRVHRMPLKHVLATRGDLAQLLNDGGGPVKGDMITVCNTGSGPNWVANSGAGYRLIADLSTDCLLAVDCQSQSGHPGTPHYSDQLAAWTNGEYHSLPLKRAAVSEIAVQWLQLLTEK